MNHLQVTDSWPVEKCVELLRLPPGKWPCRFEGFPNLLEGLRHLFAEAALNPPPPPDFPEGRGVVICAGGWRYFPSLYVTVRMLRHHGCPYPIQVWYLGDRGEYDERMRQALGGWDVGWIDANAAWRDRPGMRLRRENIDHGWMLKPFAVAYSPFKEVLFLDADSYPVQPVSRVWDHPEYRRTGAVFWPDLNPLQRGQYERFGVPPPERIEDSFESGQFLVDKSRHWAPLYATCLLNDYHEFTYKHVYGDKDTFLLAWRKAGHEYSLPAKRAGWCIHTFLQPDFDGRTQFAHRTRDKFRFFGLMDGIPLDQHFNTAQMGRQGNRYVKGLPGEPEAWAFYTECKELLRPEDCFDLLGAPWCRDIWQDVNLKNEYGLPPVFPGPLTVVDVGANVGAFANACVRRGAKHVHAVEPFPASALRLRKNLAPWIKDGFVTVHEVAAWRSDRPAGALTLRYRDGAAEGNTSVLSSLGAVAGYGPGEEAATVPAVPLDGLLEEAARAGRPVLLKIDCEGAEYPVLFTSRKLSLVSEIIGEAHPVEGVPDEAVVGGRAYTPAALASFLEGEGFRVTLDPRDGGLALFRGVRP